MSSSLAATYSATVDQLEEVRQLLDDLNHDMKTVQQEKSVLTEARESVEKRLAEAEKTLRDQRKASETLETVSKSAVDERDKMKQSLKNVETSDRQNQVNEVRCAAEIRADVSRPYSVGPRQATGD
jgi:cell division septum initiation protein DivIVA